MKPFLCILLILSLLPLSLSGCGRRVGASPSVESEAFPSAGSEASRPEESEPEAETQAPESGSHSAPEAETAPPLPSQGDGGSAETAPVEILTLTIPEGYTLARIGMTLEEKGLCTAEEFIEAAQTGNFSGYPLIAAQQDDPNRCFRLEGYLFPATYQVYSIEAPDAILRRLLEHTEKMLTAELRAEIEASGYTADEILTLASIIEKEAFGHEAMPGISSVLHNRLELGMPLQCDVTITYVEGAIKPFITGDVNRYNEHYNTYKCAALPAGAICNPGMDAIWAALRPASSDHLFFVTDADKNYYYAETWEEHLDNIEKAGLR